MGTDSQRRIAIALVLLVLAVASGVADESGHDRNVLTFGFGAGGLLGVEYERTFVRTDSFFINANLGAAGLIFGGSFSHGLAAGFGGTHAVEAGVVGTLLAVRSISLGILGPAEDQLGVAYRVRPLLGYRRQSPDGGLVVRIYFSPYITNDSALNVNDNTEDLSIVPWGGLLFGFAF